MHPARAAPRQGRGLAWIGMAGVGDAGGFEGLVERPGTGNISQLPPPLGRRPTGVVEPEVDPANLQVFEQIAKEVADDASEAE